VNGDSSTLSGSISLDGTKIDFPPQRFTVVEPVLDSTVAFVTLPADPAGAVINLAVTVTVAHANSSLAPAAGVSLGFGLNSTFPAGSSELINSTFTFKSTTTTTPPGVNEEAVCEAEMTRLHGQTCLNGGKCTMIREDCSNASSVFSKPVCDCNPAHANAENTELPACFYDQFCASKVDCTGKQGSTRSCNLVNSVKAGKDPAPIICKEDAWPLKLCSADAPPAISLLSDVAAVEDDWSLHYESDLPEVDLAMDGFWTSTMVVSLDRAMLQNGDKACFNVGAQWSQPQPGPTAAPGVRQYTHNAAGVCYMHVAIGESSDVFDSTTVAAFIAGPLILVLVLGLITVQHRRRQAGKLAEGVLGDDAIAQMDPYAKGGRPMQSTDRKVGVGGRSPRSLDPCTMPGDEKVR
jgi:hypothetical protein